MVRFRDMDTVKSEAVQTDLVDDTDAPENEVYEVGYHIVSSISEEDLAKAVTELTDLLKKNGADFVGERFPAMIDLAYPISKRVAGKKLTYTSAYFGWVAFEIAKDKINEIKKHLDASQNILRFLIVRTDRDAVHAAMSGSAVQIPAVSGDIGKPKRDQESSGEVSETALDEALKVMETEDLKTSE